MWSLSPLSLHLHPCFRLSLFSLSSPSLSLPLLSLSHTHSSLTHSLLSPSLHLHPSFRLSHFSITWPWLNASMVISQLANARVRLSVSPTTRNGSAEQRTVMKVHPTVVEGRCVENAEGSWDQPIAGGFEITPHSDLVLNYVDMSRRNHWRWQEPASIYNTEESRNSFYPVRPLVGQAAGSVLVGVPLAID
jgi:hypothetical protein